MKSDFRVILKTFDHERPMTEMEGYHWGLGYLSTVMKNLQEFEEKALESNNFKLLDNIIITMAHARDAEIELVDKISSLKQS